MIDIAFGFITVVALEEKDYRILRLRLVASYKIVGFREGIAKSCSQCYVELSDVLLSSYWLYRTTCEVEIKSHNYRSIDYSIDLNLIYIVLIMERRRVIFLKPFPDSNSNR